MGSPSCLSRPNVVLVLADNMGWGELGCYGGGAMKRAMEESDEDAMQSIAYSIHGLIQCIGLFNVRG